ncbi:N/A [soil metagenome]
MQKGRVVRRAARGLAVGLLAVATAACGATGDGSASGSGSDRARIVVTTTILGDIVQNVVGDAADVEVVMPVGADPHEFAPSARQAAAMTEADLLITNGLGFEEGLAGAIDAAADAGAPVHEVAPGADPLPLGTLTGSGDEAETHDGDDTADRAALDPHVWTDPARMADAVGIIAGRLAEVDDSLDTAAVHDRATAYASALRALDAEIETLLADIPGDRRVLVTNHEVFAYLADRYGFEVVGVLVPGGSTLAEPSAADLEDLASVIRDRWAPAIFA